MMAVVITGPFKTLKFENGPESNTSDWKYLSDQPPPFFHYPLLKNHFLPSITNWGGGWEEAQLKATLDLRLNQGSIYNYCLFFVFCYSVLCQQIHWLIVSFHSCIQQYKYICRPMKQYIPNKWIFFYHVHLYMIYNINGTYMVYVQCLSTDHMIQSYCFQIVTD